LLRFPYLLLAAMGSARDALLVFSAAKTMVSPQAAE
jgi:hypothetical protein